VEQIGLTEAIETLRAELADAVEAGSGEALHFPVEGVTLEFHVGVSRDVHADGKVKVWVLELGAGGSYKTESVQKISIKLGAPVDAFGETVEVTRSSNSKP
jgi:hypothetical protein